MMPFSGQLSGQLECSLENLKQRKMDHQMLLPLTQGYTLSSSVSPLAIFLPALALTESAAAA